MRRIFAGAIAAVCLSPVGLRAEVVRFDIVERVPAFAGRSFGDVGPYERITARATIALNPSDDRNAVITDLAQAPRNPDGKVEATADVVILRPADPARGNGTLLLDVPNRGRKLAPQLFDDSSQPGANNAQGADDAGIGFLHRQGYTMVWVGWQGDIPSRPGQMALTAPVLKGVTGPAREEFVFDTTTSPARATLTWPAADPANLTVTVRAAWADARQTPSGLSARLVDPSTVEITRPDGFDAGALYEITYTARDPALLGMGFAAVRDVASFLRRDATPANPLLNGLHPSVSRAIGFGVSQSGRFLRDFLHLGFNEDLAGPRRVRRPDAACRRHPADGDQCPLRPARPQPAPSAGPGLAGRPVPVHLCDAERSDLRQDRRPVAPLRAVRDLPQGDADRQRA